MAPNPPPLGLGHGAGKRHRYRALKRDTIQGITKGDIRRLARRGGVERIQTDIYATMRDALKARLMEILQNLVILLQSTATGTGVGKNGRKTVTTMDVCYTLKSMGATIYGFDSVYDGKSSW